MSPETTTAPIVPLDWQRIERTLEELGSACQEMEHFCAAVFDDLGALTGAVAARAEYLSQAAAASGPGDGCSACEETGRLVRGLCEEMASHWEKLYTAQQAACTQLEAVAGWGGQLSAACAQLQGLGRQLTAMEQQVRSAAQGAEQSARKGQLEKQLSELARRHEALRHERAELETELEALRVRAAELSEELREQKQRTCRLETEWAAELRRMRRALEISVWDSNEQAPASGQTRTKLGPSAGGGPEAAGGSGGSGGPGARPKSGEEHDPVLDSVMAQFELIQRDMARRRAK